MSTIDPQIVAMPADKYHADPCKTPSLSSSIIHVLCSQSPRHAWTAHPKLNPAAVQEEAEHFDLGTIAHSILLEGVDVAHKIQATRWEGKGKERNDTGEPVTDWRTGEARKERDEARAAGKVPILQCAYDEVLAMVSAARIQLDQHRDGKRAFKDGKPEQTLIWEENGIACRARLDWLMNDHSYIWDYKTTGASANPEIVSRTLFQNGYDVQAAWYLRGLEMFHAIKHEAYSTNRKPEFRFVYQETYPPYALSVVALGPDSMMLAEKKILYAMDLWKSCLESGKWPGYPSETCYATLPAWEEDRWLRKETTDVI